MKQIREYMLAMLITLLGIPVFFTSCSDSNSTSEEPTPSPESPTTTTYTVMLYRVGGGNLDDCLNYNLDELRYSKKVNFTGLIKYSSHLQETEGKEGTRQLDMTEKDGMKNVKKYEASYRMDNPQHLADFISDAKRRMPADKYILVLWNHGNSFGLDDQPVASSYPENEETTNTAKAGTRAILFDNNCNSQAMSIFELEEGLKRSGEKIDLLYWDACLMNSIENLYQVKDYVHYAMGAEHLTPGFGGNYSQLIHDLENYNTLEESMKNYVSSTVNYWKSMQEGDEQQDLVATDLTKIEPVVDAFKSYADALISNRDKFGTDSQEEYAYCLYNALNGKYNNAKDHISNNGVLYNTSESTYDGMVDMNSACTRIAGNMLNGTLSGLATTLNLAFENFIVAAKANNMPSFFTSPSVGICWAFNDFLNKSSNEYPEATNSLGKLYKLLAFDQKTGWHRFLEGNKFRRIAAISNTPGIVDYYYDLENPVHKWTLAFSATYKTEYSETFYSLKDLQKSMTLKELKEFVDNKDEQKELLKIGQEYAKELITKDVWEEEGLTELTAIKVNIATDEKLDYDVDKDKYPNTYHLTLPLNTSSNQCHKK